MTDRPVQVAEDLTRRADTLSPTGDNILIECNQNDGYERVGSLYIPIGAEEVYPTSGWVFAIGPKVKEQLSIGDFVLIEEEGIAVDHTYYDVFEVILRLGDGSLETIWPEIEVEPVLREQVSAFRRGGGSDSTLSMKDTKVNGSISFNCSDVVDWQIGEMANPSYDLTYIPVYMIVLLNEDDDATLFYITRPRKIIATLET